MGDGSFATPHIDVDQLLVDPYTELARCSHLAAIAQGPDSTGASTPWVLRHHEVRATLRDRRLSARSFPDGMVRNGMSQQAADQLTPLFRRDGEEHRYLRGLLAQAFTPRSVERLRPFTAELADRLADGIAEQIADGNEPVDFVPAFAAPLPPAVFARLFGLPDADAEQLGVWAAAVAPAFDPFITPGQVESVEAAAHELWAYAEVLVRQRQVEPGDDLITALLDAEEDGRRLSAVEVAETVSAFVFAGAETTRQQLRAMVESFALAPDVWRSAMAEPACIPRAVEEVLRHRPIVPGLTRLATEAVELASTDGTIVPVAEGECLTMSFLAANRDPVHFDHPDLFDIDRADADQHVTFGWGPHFCLGAGLARLELTESLRALTERFEPPVLDDAPPAAPSGFGAAGDQLLVRFTPR